MSLSPLVVCMSKVVIVKWLYFESLQVSVYSSRGLSDDERKRKNLLRGSAGWGSVVSKNIIGVLCVICGYVM